MDAEASSHGWVHCDLKRVAATAKLAELKFVKKPSQDYLGTAII